MTKPRVVVLSGSTRFRQEFEDLAARLTLEGTIVLMPHVWVRSDPAYADITEDAKYNIDALHLHKIDLADEMIVVDPGGYVGASTAKEIDYAERKGKVIRYTHGEPWQDHTDREEDRLAEGYYE